MGTLYVKQLNNWGETMDSHNTGTQKLKAFFKKNLDITTVKFLIVGVANTLFGTAVMFCAYNLLHLSYWISSALNYILGSILSYFLNKFFTFRSQTKSLGELIRFAVNIGLCYLLAYGAAKPLVYALLENASVSIRDNGAMLVGMGLFVILNYFGQRYFVFKKS